MWAYMTDGNTEWRDDGVPHFFSYLNSVFRNRDPLHWVCSPKPASDWATPSRRFATPTATPLRLSTKSFIDGYLYTIDVPEPGRLWGGLTGDADDDLITSVDGGQGCGE